MRAKVRLSTTSRTIDVICNVEVGDSGDYEFHWWYLTSGQRRRIEARLGKMYALYAKAEIIKVYKD